MLKVVVTVACVAAMLVAAALAVWLRDTRRTPSPLSGSEPFRERLAVTVARTGGMLTGAYLAGLLALGAGVRLLMRVLAATSSDEAQGRFTDADEVVGEVSAGGSIFLILFVGLGIAVIGLAIFAGLRRWLPDSSLAAGMIGVAIGAGALVRPTGLLDASNSDFELVTPVILAIAITLATFVLFGATFGVLVDYLAPRWPRPGRSIRGVASVIPLAMLLPSPPIFVAMAVAVLGATFVPRLRLRAQRDHSAPTTVLGVRNRVGRVLVATLGGVGGLSVLVAVVQILTL